MDTDHKITPNILYVDDLQTNLVLFQATFEKDYNIILCRDPIRALEIMRRQDIQVLVTDQRMPEMTGTELLELVATEFPQIRRFLLTAYTDFETVVEAVNKGHIHGYINKPLQADEVRRSINHSLETYYLREKNKQILKELENANTELLNMDGVKTGILKMITREIRTPLNRIMGTIHLLKDKVQSEELLDVINILDSSVVTLERFSAMAEQISALKAKEGIIEKKDISLKQLIEYTLVETAEWIKEKDVNVTIDKIEETTVHGDFDLLISGLSNLLDHALDHSEAGDTITITARNQNDCPVCELAFTGKNYSEKQLKQLSGHYTGGGKEMNLRLGLELALSQLIMESHEGYVGFKHEDGGAVRLRLVYGKGTEDLQ